MSLPKLNTPTYTTKIPSTGKSIKFRPYLVKEEKVLMLAMESENETEIFDAIKLAIESCTFGAVDINKLTTFDLEHLFLQLRIKSVGETTELGLKCEKCEKVHKVEVDLTKIKLDMNKSKDVSNKIMLTDDVGITMKYPTIDEFQNFNGDSVMDMLKICIETIFDENKVYKISEQTDEEIDEFIDSLGNNQIKPIEKWLSHIPQIKYTIAFDCGNKECLHKNSITLTGLKSFFI